MGSSKFQTYSCSVRFGSFVLSRCCPVCSCCSFFFNVLKIGRSSGRTDVLKIAGSCVVLFGSLFVGSHNKEGQPLYWLDDNYLK